jgi:hypothetical protein
MDGPTQGEEKAHMKKHPKYVPQLGKSYIRAYWHEYSVVNLIEIP